VALERTLSERGMLAAVERLVADHRRGVGGPQ
jgi:hypothetical protein